MHDKDARILAIDKLIKAYRSLDELSDSIDRDAAELYQLKERIRVLLASLGLPELEHDPR